jgi:hypothetical protein
MCQQLKPLTANYTLMFSDMHAAPNLQAATSVPMEILEQHLVRKGNATTPQATFVGHRC